MNTPTTDIPNTQVEQDHDTPVPAPAAPEGTPAPDTSRPASVMLVDDEAQMRWVLQCILLDTGFEVSEADSGKTFREAMLKPPPDLVLLDLKLPDVSGLDLLKLIRQEWPHTEVIMLTGHASIESALEAVKLGAYDYLQKPLDYKRLLATVNLALERRQLKAASERHRREMHERQRQLDLLRDTAIAANEAKRVADVAEPILKLFCDFLGWPVGHALLFRDSVAPLPISGSYWSLSSARNYATFQRITDDGSVNLRNDWIAQAGLETDVLWSHDISREKAFTRSHAARACGLKTGLAAPIFCDGHLVGALEFYAGSVAPPTSNQRVAASQVAAQLGRVFEREITQLALRSAHAELEAALHQQSRKLDQSEVALEDTVSQNIDFLDALSLEFRAPLTEILSHARDLQINTLGPLSNDQTTTVKRIHDQTAGLRSLLENMVDFARLKTGRAPLKTESFDVHELCASIVRETRQFACAKKIEVTLKSDAAPTPITADKQRLTRLLQQLLNNAVKFTPRAGKVGLEATWFDAERSLAFVVWDNGVGIREAEQKKIFEPFVRLDSSEGGETPGFGLGLAIARQIVRLHGGTIELESAPNEGSRFTVLLPCAEQAASRSPE